MSVTTPPTTIADDRCLTDLDQLGPLLERLGVRSIFLVADGGAYRLSGAEAKLAPLLARVPAVVFSAFEPNPKFEQVLEGLAEFRRCGADLLLAIGGGTAIDIAKLIGVLAATPAEPLAVARGEHPPARSTCPLVVAPTTSGSGSEATQFAVVYVDGVKHSVDHPHLLPAYCVLDPSLTAKLPAGITAHCGLDAFSQAIESIWSVRATEHSLRDAFEGARLAFAHLHDAVHAPTPVARQAMCRASHLAGRAINETRTTASHAISYAITTGYGVPHGHAVALTLGAMLLHNAGVTDDDVNDPRGAAYVQGRIRQILDLLGCETAEQGSQAIQDFVRSLGCEVRLSAVGVRTPEELRAIVGKVNLERLKNNPRQLTGSQLFSLLESIG